MSGSSPPDMRLQRRSLPLVPEMLIFNCRLTDSKVFPDMGQQMQGYSAYLIGPDGHIMRRIELSCTDDETAKAEAQKLAKGHDTELWQGARIIGTFTRED